MLFAINVPQSKSVSIAFVSLKSMVLGLLVAVVTAQVSEKSVHWKCVQSMASLLSVLTIVFLLGIIIDLCALGYFYLSREFKKVEYYIFYAFHLIISCLCAFGALTTSLQASGCFVSRPFAAAIVASALLLQVNILVTMISNLFIVLKFMHFGSNLVWLAVWISTLECPRVDLTLIAFVHALLSVGNAVTLGLYRWYGKTGNVVKLWRTLCIVSLFLMVFCYLVVLVGLGSASDCQEDDFFIKVYIRYGLFEIISPLLILIFLRNEAGDPREEKVKLHNEIFTKIEHEYVDFGAKI